MGDPHGTGEGRGEDPKDRMPHITIITSGKFVNKDQLVQPNPPALEEGHVAAPGAERVRVCFLMHSLNIIKIP